MSVTHVGLADVMHPDLLILTIKANEFEAICDELAEKKIALASVDGHPDLHTFSLKNNEGKREIRIVVVAGVSDQGPEMSGIFTTSFLHLLHPAAAMMIGMCAGLSGRMILGDVAIICRAFPLEGVVNQENQFRSDNRSIEASREAKSMAQFVTTDICPALIKFTSTALPKARIVDGYSGSSVLESTKGLPEPTRKIKAYEMEASAFMTACEVYKTMFCVATFLCLGVYKGVSDLADEASRADSQLKKNYQITATRNAFRVALYGIQGCMVNVLAKDPRSSHASRAYMKTGLVLSDIKKLSMHYRNKVLQELEARPEGEQYAVVHTSEKKYLERKVRIGAVKSFTPAQLKKLYPKEEKVPQFLKKLVKNPQRGADVPYLDDKGKTDPATRKAKKQRMMERGEKENYEEGEEDDDEDDDEEDEEE